MAELSSQLAAERRRALEAEQALLAERSGLRLAFADEQPREEAIRNKIEEEQRALEERRARREQQRRIVRESCNGMHGESGGSATLPTPLRAASMTAPASNVRRAAPSDSDTMCATCVNANQPVTALPGARVSSAGRSSLTVAPSARLQSSAPPPGPRPAPPPPRVAPPPPPRASLANPASGTDSDAQRTDEESLRALRQQLDAQHALQEQRKREREERKKQREMELTQPAITSICPPTRSRQLSNTL